VPGGLLLLAGAGILAFTPGLTRLAGFLALLGALLVALSLPGNQAAWRARALSAPGRRLAKGAARLAVCLAALLAAGALTALPAINVAAPDEAFLPEETLALLRRLDGEVTLTARTTARSEGPARRLLGLYAKASPRVIAAVEPAQGRSAGLGEGGLALAEQDTVTVAAEGFEETVFPVSRGQIDAALRRLISPPRLVYCLMGEGAKSSMDTGPRGLSVWARHLARRKIYVRDWEWTAGEPLPPQAHAFVLAGPRMPLDEAKELELLALLSRGGKLMSLNDPLVAALSPGLFSPLTLLLPEGLVIDQTMSWAGTEDSFVVSEDFPAHPATMGQREPVIFPLAGAVFASDVSAAAPQARKGSGTAPAGPPASEAAAADEAGPPPPGGAAAAGGAGQVSDSAAPGTRGGEAEAPQAQGGGPLPAPADGQGQAFVGHTWAVAVTSGGAFLETDRESVGRKEPRFDRAADPAGPLVLASATSLAGGGRLVLAADSDFASNSYIGFAGNLSFATGLISWLTGTEDDLAGPRQGTVLIVTDSLSRFFFWGPVVFWPLAALLAWGRLFLRRRKASA
jgi:hypothetical protein